MTDLFFALILFLFPLAYSPGPGNLFFAANGARFGVLATAPASAGYHVATFLVTLAIGLGFGAAMQGAPGLAMALRIAGAAYVIWLALGFLRAGPMDEGATARRATFRDGAVLLALNPKAYVIVGLMFSQFLTPANRSPGLVLAIAAIFTLNNLIAFLVWTVAGDALGRAFRSQAAARPLNIVFGLSLAGVAVWMLLG
jgi:threonine/homoserine/homoserine lactone efflux protein